MGRIRQIGWKFYKEDDPPEGIEVEKSKHYRQWMTQKDYKVCLQCMTLQGKVFLNDEIPEIYPPLHGYGRCVIQAMGAIRAGTATDQTLEGADWWIRVWQQLPSYYVTMEEAENQGWKSKKGNLDKVLPGRMIGGNIYQNRDRRLPYEVGRVWYEADINYTGGYRNSSRLLYSNDGLVFVTYDHYYTFFEII